MRWRWKSFLRIYLGVGLLYLVVFFYSLATLMHYEDFQDPNTEYMDWSTLTFGQKAADVGYHWVGFPLGYWWFFLNALVAAAAIYLGLLIFRRFRN